MLKIHDEESQIMVLKLVVKSWPVILSGVPPEILNPEQHIATLDRGKLVMK